MTPTSSCCLSFPVLCPALLNDHDFADLHGLATLAGPARPRRFGATDALSGEYTDPSDPTRRSAFTSKTASLSLKSERMVPTALIQNSPTEFGSSADEDNDQVHASMGLATARPWSRRTIPRRFTSARGTPVHHVFHDYQRTEVMIPMRDGIKLHTSF